MNIVTSSQTPLTTSSKRKLRSKTKQLTYISLMVLLSSQGGTKLKGCNDLAREIMSFLIVLPIGITGPRKRGNGHVHQHVHTFRPSAFYHYAKYLKDTDQEGKLKSSIEEYYLYHQ
jgi:hypothetical protein